MARGTAKEATGKQSLLLIWLRLFLLLFAPYERQPLFASWSVLYLSHRLRQPFSNYKDAGADPGFFLGGGALVSCSTSTPINHIVFFWQNTSCIRKLQVISAGEEGGGGVRNPCTLPLDPPLRCNRISKLFQSPFKAQIIFLKILGFNGDNVKCVVSSFIVKGIKTKFTYVVDKTLDYVPINFLSIGN